MDKLIYMKSIVDMERAAIVICNLDHKIIYMNPVAVRRYEKRGGSNLIGKLLKYMILIIL
ncbi:MAG: hypothetical protein GX309_04145 [Clostridiales bacterium]|nr:hypothetical protein [Clostridiales bacterium]